MTNPLATFTPRPAQTGDSFQARHAVGRPLLVQVTSYDGAKETKDRTTGQLVLKKAVFVDVWDFVGGAIADHPAPPGGPNTVYIGAMWMAGALVDNLAPFVNAPPMPVKIISRPNQRSQGSHLALEPLAGPELDYVTQAFNADPGRFDRERQQRAQQQAVQQHAAGTALTGLAPMQGGPQFGQVQPSAPAQQYQQPAAPQYAPPPQQFGQPASPAELQWAAQQQAQVPPQQFAPAPGPVANMPAQVAQQWAPVGQAMDQAQQYMQQGVPAEQAAQMAVQQFALAPPAQPAPPMQQPPAPQFAAPGSLPGQLPVNDTNVAQLLQNLTHGQQPQQ